MGSLSEAVKTWLVVTPTVIAGVYFGRLVAKLHNQEIEHRRAIEAIKRKSNSANIVRQDAAGSKDGI